MRYEAHSLLTGSGSCLATRVVQTGEDGIGRHAAEVVIAAFVSFSSGLPIDIEPTASSVKAQSPSDNGSFH